ncbi:MAG: response regulator, partial [Desulfobacteraceae bacterium]|nr:response regulator [Desulfobacteraceae bacterium]
LLFLRDLTESEKKAHDILNNTKLHMWAFDGEYYSYMNNEWYDYTGQDPALPLTIERWTEMVHPGDLDTAVKTWLRHWETKTEHDNYFRLKSKDGGYRYFYCHAVPILNEDGSFKHFQGFNIDITERRQTEEALQAREAFLDRIIDQSPFAIWISDSEGTLQRANPSLKRFLNLTDEQLVGKYNVFKDTLAEKQGLIPLFRTVYEEGKSIRFTCDWDGNDIPTMDLKGSNAVSIEAAMFPIHNLENELTNVVLSWIDITERKRADVGLRQAKEAAEAANKSKSAFLANMSHELRTPLNAVLGFSQLLVRSRNFDTDERKYLEIIHRNGEHLLKLINDVLDISKIEAGRTILTEKDFDLYRLINDVENMFHLKAGEKGLQMVFACDTDVPQYVRTDEGKLRQVLVNLVDNAIKFTENGAVTLWVWKMSGNSPKKVSLTFEVEDTGKGIASGELDSLFDAFVQSESGLKSIQGTGLGLPISRKFVHMMGGDITVESKIGKGSVFRFVIQAETAESAELKTAQPEKRVIALEPGQPVYRILIADNNADNRMLLVRLVTLPGFEIREAEHGKEAVNIWKAWKPHLIFMDISMPVTDGYEATREVRKLETFRFQAKIIAVTANAFEEGRVGMLSAGCDDFVCKPLETSEIFDVIHRHLGVRFVYEDAEVGTRTETGAKTAAMMTEMLAALPPDLLSTLKQAATDGDSQRLHQTIAGIRQHDAMLAEELIRLTDDFAFDTILNMIQKLLQDD